MSSTKKIKAKRAPKGQARYAAVIAFRIPQDIHKAIKDEADRDARTMADVARDKLTAAFRRKRA